VLKRFLEGYATAHRITLARLVREVLAEWVYEKVDHTPSKRVDHTLQNLDLLSKQLQLKVAVLPTNGGEEDSALKLWPAGEVTIPGQGRVRYEEEGTVQPRVDTVKERESMYWMVVAMLKEAMKLSENEALAKTSGSRLDAMMVAGALVRLGEAVLEGYDRAYIQPHVDELTRLIEQLKEQIKQPDQKGQEHVKGSTAT
jgi:hypothetical protein